MKSKAQNRKETGPCHCGNCECKR